MESNMGFVTISRSLVNASFWCDGYDAALFFYFLLRASHNRFGLLKPGQSMGTITSIAKTLGWSRNGVAKHLERLKQLEMIMISPVAGGMIFTVCHWDEICNWDPESRTHSSADKPAQNMGTGAHIMNVDAHSMSTDCSYREHNQKVYQNKPKTSDAREAEFEKWWAEYPRHGRKEEARNAWFRLNVPAETLMSALQNAKVSRDWLREGGRFIPTAVKWLDGYWEDFITQNESEAENSWTEY